MRIDKLTTAFQQALQDASSAAVARDNPYIEPSHVLAAMLQQPDGPRSLLERAGVNVSALATSMETAMRNLPTVQGGGQAVQPGRQAREAGGLGLLAQLHRCGPTRRKPKVIFGCVVAPRDGARAGLFNRDADALCGQRLLHPQIGEKRL